VSATVEIEHHRDHMLPVDDRARAWLARNGIDLAPSEAEARWVGVRDEATAYVVDGDRSIRLGPDIELWPVTVPLGGLVEHATTRLVATAEINGEHYGVARTADERGHEPLDRALSAMAVRAYSRPCVALDCDGRSHSTWEFHVGIDLNDRYVPSGQAVDLCNRCASGWANAVARSVAHVVTRVAGEPEPSGRVEYDLTKTGAGPASPAT
jgi:hypothetical protein